MKNNKKGGATVYLVIIVLLLIAIAGMFIRLNWRRFKAETSFALSMIAIVIVLLLVIFILIRHAIRKARKEKEQEKARREREKFEAEVIAAGGTPGTLGNGQLEMSDIGEAADKAMDKIDDFFSGKEDQNE
ncbi:MAG: hypothetical protein E7227_03040 [Clostridiales bacterium]|nr:hypothetical protein [Clostridiales bacterium]